ncbi:TraR/DksA C4-type zinc finger protein [Desulfopila inferna]|uniref:TraR/DksA C4-type zinc finger protein n=1 Tax=Desulfopila inferna TaxID=468528 RepID=UPI00196481FE|nr:TraR/DksA C4-type zinc finger protein [Desulfopila inferna]MBM9605381.1 TraR/DksA C4-type zinc finger protein [Desulfopila inferna]
MEREQQQNIEKRLKDLHQELIEKRQKLEEARINLGLKEVEFEENATNAQMADGLDRLDDQVENEIAAINHALDRLRLGEYEICESCGRTISAKRLEALPWTASCIRCAKGEEGEVGEEDLNEEEAILGAEEQVELPEDLQGLNDEQLEAAVIDAILRDGQVPLDDLSVTCSKGFLRVEGALPDKRQHSHLQEIIYDVLGFRDVEEIIRIDRTAWARKDRTPGINNEEEEEPDSAEGVGTETIEAVKEGKTISPADEIIPEKGGRK